MSPLILFLALLAPAQNTSQTAPGQTQGAPSFQRQYRQFHNLNPDQTVTVQNGLFDDHTCFTMRTYYFTREDGKAPELKGTSTCTPANVLRRGQAKRPDRKPLLVPLNLQ